MAIELSSWILDDESDCDELPDWMLGEEENRPATTENNK